MQWAPALIETLLPEGSDEALGDELGIVLADFHPAGTTTSLPRLLKPTSATRSPTSTSRSVTYEGSISGLWSVDTLTFEPRGEGTRIVFENRTTTPTLLRPISPILNAAFQPQARRAVEGARRYLQAHPHH